MLLLLGGLRGVQSAGEGVRTEHWGFPGGGLHDGCRQRYEPTWESTVTDFLKFQIRNRPVWPSGSARLSPRTERRRVQINQLVHNVRPNCVTPPPPSLPIWR